MRLTEEQIEAGRSPKGGWTRAQLAVWGVPWPPPKGWRIALTCGRDPVKLSQPLRQPEHYSDNRPHFRFARKNSADDFPDFPLAKYWFHKPKQQKLHT